MIFIPGMVVAQRETRIPLLSLQAANNDSANLSSYTTGTVSFGTANADRQIFVAVMGQGATQSLSSASIGGVAATILAQSASANGCCAIIGANVPTGATGTCTFNFSGTMQRMSFHLFGGNGWILTPFSIATDGTLTNPKALSVNVQNGGAIIASVSLNSAGSANASFTGVTFSQNTPVENVNNTLTSGLITALTGQLARAISITSTAGAPAANFQGAAVSLAPKIDLTV